MKYLYSTFKHRHVCCFQYKRETHESYKQRTVVNLLHLHLRGQEGGWWPTAPESTCISLCHSVCICAGVTGETGSAAALVTMIIKETESAAALVTVTRRQGRQLHLLQWHGDRVCSCTCYSDKETESAAALVTVTQSVTGLSDKKDSHLDLWNTHYSPTVKEG